MSNILELVEEEKMDVIKTISKQAELTTKKLKKYIFIDAEDIANDIQNAIVKFGIPESIIPKIYFYQEYIDVDFYDKTKTYEDIIKFDGSFLSYNGNHIKYNNELVFGTIRAIVRYEASIPNDIKDLLRACDKIQDVSTIQATVMC